jgi:hypothetical protein
LFLFGEHMAQQNMGLGPIDNAKFKKKFRWMISIDRVAGPDSKQDGTINNEQSILPPSKAARPNISFKTIEAQHLNEVIHYPGKPDWKPINITLYDINCGQNPVFNWIKKIYDAQAGNWSSHIVPQYKKTAYLKMYSGCGHVMEEWVYENAWPESVEFGDLDFGSSEVVVADITLRYDRAYTIINDTGSGSGYTNVRPVSPGSGFLEPIPTF